MPGFTDDCNSSSLSIARWLYATLTASSILERNPDIKEGLEKILTASDSVLTKSKLSKDGELKIAALQATPWINNANRETERIRSLKKYLDDETVSRLADEKISALKKLQESDGGWTWFEGMKSSPFITSQIIKILGYLKDKDLLPSDMEVMAQRSVRYYDSWLVENERKYHSINVEGTLDYLYSRGKLGFPINSGMEKIEKSVLDSVAKRWKYYSPGKKAEAALVLSQHKKYRDAAKMIMASLEEFTNAKTTLCDEAMMLEAFEKLSPESLACEKVRESIYLRKETEDWGTNPDNVSLIYSLVNSAPVDVTPRSLPEIFVGAKRLEFSKEESLIGCFTLNVDPSYISGKKLLIKRSSGVPGWGGVISQYVAEIQDVKKVNVENLSIDKHIYKVEADGSVKEVKTFEKGDKVSVVLNLEVGKDMEYVVLVDSRSSCLSVDDQGSGIIFKDGLIMYRENRFSTTSFFIENLRAGKYVLSYDCHVDRSGVYSVGIAEVQCLYSPTQVAHSGGRRIVSR